MRKLQTINELIEKENLENTSTVKRCVEHFFRASVISMEDGIEEIRVPYLGKLERRKNGKRSSRRI